jgi:hypothetical protein
MCLDEVLARCICSNTACLMLLSNFEKSNGQLLDLIMMSH